MRQYVQSSNSCSAQLESNIMTIKANANANAVIKSAVATIIKADGSIAKAIESLARAGFTYATVRSHRKAAMMHHIKRNTLR